MQEQAQFEMVNLDITGSVLAYPLARKPADLVAADKLSEPMLVAWYDGKTKTEHPHVPECQHQPGWIAYAEGHGGKLQININKTEYCFIFADAVESI
jgi:Domain of unknown function (DUF5619)